MLALPQWEAIVTTIVLSMIIVMTIVGNILVILSVFSFKPLRTTQNFYIVSLAVADLTVAICVLPFNVAYMILGRWYFGIHLCKMWLTCDIMCCTSSILSLCVIALDRYWAIADPLKNIKQRSTGRVLGCITGVWVLSFLISSPPLFGWNDWPDEFTSTTPCHLTSDRGYVVYSSLGSFFIPLLIMTVVYVKIYLAMRRRLRERAVKSLMKTMSSNGSGVQRRKKQRSKFKRLTESGIPILKSLKRRKSNEAEAEAEVEIHAEAEVEVEISEDPQAVECAKAPTPTSEDPAAMELEECGDSNMDVDVEKTKGGVQRTFTDVHQFVEQRQRVVSSRERRAARTLGIIMGVFVICWLPFFLMYIILPFCSSCHPTNRFTQLITWLGYINSALNPVIYTIFNVDFRRAMKRLLGFK